jgi:hypothetical protein
LVVNMGSQPKAQTTRNRVFTVRIPTPLPSGVTSATVTASYATGAGETFQPLNRIQFAALNNTGAANPMSVNAGVQVQCNFRTSMTARQSGEVFHPVVTVTITYGTSGARYTFTVPVTITVQ